MNQPSLLGHGSCGRNRNEELAQELYELGRLIGTGVADVQHVAVQHPEPLRQQIGTRPHHVQVIDGRLLRPVSSTDVSEYEDRRRIACIGVSAARQSDRFGKRKFWAREDDLVRFIRSAED